MSIRRWLLLIVFAVWLPAVAGFGLLARSTYLREASDAREDIARLAEGLNLLVERELDKRVVMASMLGASPALAGGDMRTFHAEASLATEGTGSWALLLDRETQPVNTRLPYEGYVPLRRRPNMPFYTEGTGVSFNAVGSLYGKPVVAAYSAARGMSPVRYNVAVAFPPATIQAIIDHQVFPDNSVASVIDATHTIVGRSRDPDKWLGQQASAVISERIRRDPRSIARTTTLDGVPSLTYVTAGNRYGWAVVMALPQASLSSAARRVTAEAVAASAVMLVIGLGLALVFAQRIGSTVVALRRSAALVGEDRVPPLLATGVEETDAVGAALHAAARRSQEATRTLETRVTEAVRKAESAQAALLDAQKHEAIGRLTGGLAHDFNNLLQTIKTGLHVLGRSIAEDSPQHRVQQAAMRATGKAADLVRQMLAFGRSQPLEPRPVVFDDFMLQHAELTRKAVGERVTLTVDAAPGLPPLYVDPAAFELAILNLVFNARDALANRSGQIRITARSAASPDTDGLADGEYVRIEVADDGPGMDDATRRRAFEPYFTTKPIGAGSGMGLSQVLAFARQSNGNAALDSALGRGTRVRLVLPVAPASALAEVSAGEPAVPPLPLRPLRVLVAEDDPLVSSVVVPALQALGHVVNLQGTADDAKRVLEGGATFDVLFTDVVMPGSMTGVDLAQWVRAERPGLAVVIATGYTVQSMPAGVPVLHKPYTVEALVAALAGAAA